MAEEKVILEIEFPNVGIIELELKKILSPLTIEKIIKLLYSNKEIKTMARYYIKAKDIYMIKINLQKEAERPVFEMKKGEVAYEPLTDSILIALNQCKLNSKISILGKIIKGNEILERLPQSTGCKIKMRL